MSRWRIIQAQTFVFPNYTTTVPQTQTRALATVITTTKSDTLPL